MSARSGKIRHVDAACETTVSKRMRMFSGDLPQSHFSSPAGIGSLEGQKSLDVSDLECPICLEFLLDPVVGPCGHDYCKACIHKWTARHNPDQPVSCPTCRQAMLPPGVRELGVCIRLKTLLERAFPQKTAERRIELKAAESESASRRAAEASVREVTIRSALHRSYRPSTPLPPASTPLTESLQAQSLAQMREAFERGSAPNPTMPAFLTALSTRPARPLHTTPTPRPHETSTHTSTAPTVSTRNVAVAVAVTNHHGVPSHSDTTTTTTSTPSRRSSHSHNVSVAMTNATATQVALSQRESILAMRATLAQSHHTLVHTLSHHHHHHHASSPDNSNSSNSSDSSLQTSSHNHALLPNSGSSSNSSSRLFAPVPLSATATAPSHTSIVSPFTHSSPYQSSDKETSEEYERPHSGSSTAFIEDENAPPAGLWSPSAWASNHTRHSDAVCAPLPSFHHRSHATPLPLHDESALPSSSSQQSCETGSRRSSRAADSAAGSLPVVHGSQQFLHQQQQEQQHYAAALAAGGTAAAAAAAAAAALSAPAADEPSTSWHDQTADMSVRGRVADALLTLMLHRRPITLIRFQNRLVHFVQLLERNIYRSSTSRAAFADMTTLETRLQGAAQHILASNSFRRS